MTKRMQNTRANPKIPSFDKTMEIVFAVSAGQHHISRSDHGLHLCSGTASIIKIGVSRFIFGSQWKPSAESPQFGIFP